GRRLRHVHVFHGRGPGESRREREVVLDTGVYAVQGGVTTVGFDARDPVLGRVQRPHLELGYRRRSREARGRDREAEDRGRKDHQRHDHFDHGEATADAQHDARQDEVLYEKHWTMPVERSTATARTALASAESEPSTGRM